jgi:two-component system chemotaxis response regulator CheB
MLSEARCASAEKATSSCLVEPAIAPSKVGVFVQRDIIVIGASAGGVETLGRLVERLPAHLKAALFVTVHFPNYGTSALPKILNRKGLLSAKHPENGELITPGHIYVAPPGQHLSILDNAVRLSRGPRENGHRPSIDVLFQTAARTHKDRVIGIVLSGTLDDGTAGLMTIKAMGGLAIVQDPEEATYVGMPQSAIDHVAVDYVLTVEKIAACLIQLVKTPKDEVVTVTSDLPSEVDWVTQDKTSRERGEHPGAPSPLTCPDCGGVLWELRQNDLIRYRCHIGHVYSEDGIVAQQADDVERALWSAVRALEEKAALARRMAVNAREQQRLKSEAGFLARAREAEDNAALVRQVILQEIPLEAFEQ